MSYIQGFICKQWENAAYIFHQTIVGFLTCHVRSMLVAGLSVDTMIPVRNTCRSI